MKPATRRKKNLNTLSEYNKTITKKKKKKSSKKSLRKKKKSQKEKEDQLKQKNTPETKIKKKMEVGQRAAFHHNLKK